MFRQFSCGCMVSVEQGRVRTCASHKPDKASGDGGGFENLRGGKVKYYPANGQAVPGWAGR